MVLIKCRGQEDHLTAKTKPRWRELNSLLVGLRSTMEQPGINIYGGGVLKGELGATYGRFLGEKGAQNGNTVGSQFLFSILHRSPS